MVILDRWDEATGLPLPPLESVFPTEAGYWATVIFSALSMIVLVYGLINIRQHKGQVVLLLMLGGLLTVFVEPFLDVIGAAWHPEIDQNTAFENFGRAIPWWVVAVYLFFFGGLGAINYLALEKGATRKLVWLWFFIPVMVDIVMEEIMMAFGLYYYYGNQPLILFFNFPLWWAPCNTMGEFLGVSMLLLLMPYLTGMRKLVIPLLFPLADAIGYAAVGLPSLIAVNTQGTPEWLVQLAGVSTWILALVIVHLVSLVVAEDSPLRVDGKVHLRLP